LVRSADFDERACGSLLGGPRRLAPLREFLDDRRLLCFRQYCERADRIVRS
jgi:hypothetical protein